MQEAIVAGAVLAPLALYLLLRYKAGLVFLSLALGVLLASSADSAELAKQLSPFTGPVGPETVTEVITFAPAVIAMLVTVRLGPKPFGIKGLPSVLIALAIGAFALTAAVPLLPHDPQNLIHSSQLWEQIFANKIWILVGGSLLSLAHALSRKQHLHSAALLPSKHEK